MKILPFKIPKPEQNAFVFQIDHDTLFYDKLHQHEEIQISFIVEGEGTLVVGDSIHDYYKGDVLVIGSNLPHVFKSNTEVSKTSHMLSLFFTKSSFGDAFFELEELKTLKPFFKRAKHGFKITSKHKLVADLFLKFEKSDKLTAFLLLLQLLKIASYSQYKSLSSFIYDKTYSDNEGHRMRNIFEFTMDNYKKDMSLETVAEVANMTKNAFCKYFKKRTNKTYFQFLFELRIENACKLLDSDSELTIMEVAEKSGFKNMSHFNKQFKKIKNVSPSAFRKQHQ